MKRTFIRRMLGTVVPAFIGVAISAGFSFAAKGVMQAGTEFAASASRALFGAAGLTAVALVLACSVVGAIGAAKETQESRAAFGALRALGHGCASLAIRLSLRHIPGALIGACLGLFAARFLTGPIAASAFGGGACVSIDGILCASLVCAVLCLSAYAVYFVTLRASPVQLMDESLCETSGLGGAGARRLNPLSALRCAFFQYKRALILAYCAGVLALFCILGVLTCTSAVRAARAQADDIDHFTSVLGEAAPDSLPVYLSAAHVERADGAGIRARARLLAADGTRDFFSFTPVSKEADIALPAYGALVTKRMAETLKLSPGDMITVTDENNLTALVMVRQIVENYFGDRVIIGARYFEEVFSKPFSVNAYLARGDASGTSLSDELEYAAIAKLATYAGCALLALGLIVAFALYQVLRTRLSERESALGMLLASGYTHGETKRLYMLDCSIVALSGVLVAFVLSGALHGAAARALETYSAQLARVPSPLFMALGAALALLAVSLPLIAASRAAALIPPSRVTR